MPDTPAAIACHQSGWGVAVRSVGVSDGGYESGRRWHENQFFQRHDKCLGPVLHRANTASTAGKDAEVSGNELFWFSTV